MKPEINLFGSVLLAGICCVSMCTTDPVQLSGNSSQTPNALVGTLYEPDGETPARGVRVNIRPHAMLAMNEANGVPAVPGDSASAVSDDSGWFRFDTSLAAGTYVIEAISGANALFIDSVQIRKNAAPDTLAPDTLEPAGAISGTIRLAQGGDPREVYVLAFGIDRFANVNSDGSFVFRPLAEGRYDLRLITSLADYAPLDTIGISVQAGDTTRLGTLGLRYTGIPAISGVQTVYDSGAHLMTVSWNRQDTALIKKYNVYRTVLANGSVSKKVITTTDTVLADSMYAGYARVIGYQVAGVDNAGQEGLKSEAVRFESGIGIGAETGLRIGEGLLSDRMRMCADEGGDLWTIDYGTGTIRRFDGDGTLKTSWTADAGADGNGGVSGYYPSPIAVDARRNVYLLDRGSACVRKFDSAGMALGTLHDTAVAAIYDMCVDSDGCVYINYWKTNGTSQWINKYDRTGAVVYSMESGLGVTRQYGLTLRNGKLYCAASNVYRTGSGVQEHLSVARLIYGDPLEIKCKGDPYCRDVELSGDTTKRFACLVMASTGIAAADFDVDDAGTVYGIDAANNIVWIRDTTGGESGCFKVASGSVTAGDDVLGIAILSDGTIALGLARSSDHSGAIHIFRRPQ